MPTLNEVISQVMPEKKGSAFLQAAIGLSFLFSVSQIKPFEVEKPSMPSLSSWTDSTSGRLGILGAIGAGTLGIILGSRLLGSPENKTASVLRGVIEGVNPDGTHLVTWDSYGINDQVAKKRDVHLGTRYIHSRDSVQPSKN